MQLFVGEIGISRREFLYDITFWEARRIIRGYYRRNVLNYQLLRLTAYSSFFSMRENKENKSPDEWIPLYFDEDDDIVDEMMSQDDADDLLSEIEAFNAMNDSE